MFYKSTRGEGKEYDSAFVIKKGISSDGGLFIPAETFKIDLEKISNLANVNYKERAKFILSNFLTDFSQNEINDCVEYAYKSEKWEGPNTVPLVKLSDKKYILELWHGPTSAFKDVALQILPVLMFNSLRKCNDDKDVVILTATSGDTGKAALEGFKNIDGTQVIVFFPEEGVSTIQKLQMVTQEGDNVASIAVEGNFDDTQNGVKAIFFDKDISKKLEENGFEFSSANSINWGRLVPQIVYYFSAYADLIKNGTIRAGDKINFVVPTGNFGNILAGYYAYSIGLPVNRFICASNDNNVLTEFINTGSYNRNREFYRTSSPSMDILISSNLERLLYHLNGNDFNKINEWMTLLKVKGEYSVDDVTLSAIKEIFYGDYSVEADVKNRIKSTYDKYGYIMDTHTAVGMDVYEKYIEKTGDNTVSVILSTASPFKFCSTVLSALMGDEAIKDKSELEMLEVLSKEYKLDIPNGLRELDKKKVLHGMVCDKSKEAMQKCIEKIIFV
jgi:threonine synthase